jgi:hypothetical protein
MDNHPRTLNEAKSQAMEDICRVIFHGAVALFRQWHDPLAWVATCCTMIMGVYLPFWNSADLVGADPASIVGLMTNAINGYVSYMLVRYGFPTSQPWQWMMDKLKKGGVE